MPDDTIIQKLQEHDARFDNVDEKLDKLTMTVIEHGERLDQTVTKTEFEAFRKDQSDANDQIITILKRLDEAHYLTMEWIRLRKVENEVEEQKKKTLEHEVVLQRIKKELNLAAA